MDASPPPSPPPGALPRLSAQRRSALVTLAVVLIVIAIQWIALRQYRAIELEQAGTAFERIVDQSTVSLTQQTAQYQNALLGLRAFYFASDKVSAAEFDRYVRSLDIEHALPGLRAFAFNRDIRGEERQAYLSWVRSQLSKYDPIYTNFEIYPTATGYRHHVVESIHPALGNLRSLGYDLLSNDIRRLTIEHARNRGFAATPPIRLQQAPNAIAVLMIAPVSVSSWDGTHSSRHTVAASFLVSELVNTAIAPTLRRHFHLQIDDQGPDDEPGVHAELLFEDPQAVAADANSLPPLIRTHLFGGRRWEMRFTPRNGGIGLIPAPVVIALLLGGAVMAGTISHLVQQRIRRAARHRALARQASDCVLELDAAGIVRSADNSVTRITGVPASRWQGRPLWESVAEQDADAAEQHFREVVTHGKSVALECRVPGPDSTPRWVEIRLGNHLQRRNIGAVLAQISDIDTRKEAEAEIARLAFFDPLTQLPNRRLLEQRAELTFSAARRHRGRAAVLVLDLDGFKQINDQAGHATGDAVLATVAQRLLAAVRDSDTVARLGGDEFVILLGEPANEVDVRAAAARLTRDMALPLNVDGRNWFVSASIGMAMYPDHGLRFAELLSLADIAMYRSKRGGSGLSTLADPPAGAVLG